MVSYNFKDPFREKFQQAEILDKVKAHYELFPYDSVFVYGSTDRLHKWYEILGEIIEREDTSSSNEVQ